MRKPISEYPTIVGTITGATISVMLVVATGQLWSGAHPDIIPAAPLTTSNGTGVIVTHGPITIACDSMIADATYIVPSDTRPLRLDGVIF